MGSLAVFSSVDSCSTTGPTRGTYQKSGIEVYARCGADRCYLIPLLASPRGPWVKHRRTSRHQARSGSTSHLHTLATQTDARRSRRSCPHRYCHLVAWSSAMDIIVNAQCGRLPVSERDTKEHGRAGEHRAARPGRMSGERRVHSNWQNRATKCPSAPFKRAQNACRSNSRLSIPLLICQSVRSLEIIPGCALVVCHLHKHGRKRGVHYSVSIVARKPVSGPSRIN